MIKIRNPPVLNTNRKACWTDRHPFDGLIYHYPTRETKGLYWGAGVFCSLACAKRFILMTYDGQYNILKLFENMTRDVFRVDVTYAAPWPYILGVFHPDSSSTVTIDQFRAIPSATISSNLMPHKPCVTQRSVELKGLSEQSGILCWHDGYPCLTTPVPICTKYSHGTFHVMGYFCSLNCAKRYLTDRALSMHPFLTLFSLLCLLVYRTDPSQVRLANTPYCLGKYSTSNAISITDFRHGFVYPTPDTQMRVVYSPIHVQMT